MSWKKQVRVGEKTELQKVAKSWIKEERVRKSMKKLEKSKKELEKQERKSTKELEKQERLKARKEETQNKK